MNKVLLLADVSNLYYTINSKFRRKLDYFKYLNSIISVDNGNELYRAYAYGAQIAGEANDFLNCLRSFGYILKYKVPKSFENPNYQIRIEAIEEVIKIVSSLNKFDITLLNEANDVLEKIKKVLRTKRDTRKADWDVGLAIDAVRLTSRVDTVVIGSADGDLAPLAEWIKENGCICNVYACNVSRELKDVADNVIEIDYDVLE